MIKLSLISLALITTVSGSVFAAGKAATPECTASISVQPAGPMKFVDSSGKDLKEINFPEKCRSQPIQFNLENKLDLPKAAMGHNLVIHELAKEQAIVADALKAGPAADYTPATKDGVLGHTKTLGPKEKDEVKIAAGTFKKGTDYAYVCTFAGHSAVMNGKINFVK